MAVNIGPQIGIEGEAEFRRQINQLIQQQKTLESEMKKVVSSFDEHTTAEEKAEAQARVLNKQISVQEERVKLLEKGLREAIDKWGEADSQTQRWQQALNEANADLNTMRKRLSDVDSGLDDVNGGLNDTGKSLSNAGKNGVSFGNILKGNVVSQAIIGGVKSLASGFVSIAQAIGGFIGKSVLAAADMKALDAQYKQTFSETLPQANQILKSVSEETGIYDTRLKGAATSIYAFAKANKATNDEALDLMQRGLVAAADNAAYYDKTLEESAETLQSFLKGNYENDAALGLSAREFTRNAAAVELFGKNFNELSEIQKQETLLQMVLDAQAASGAMGQAARESGEWTNTMGNLNAAWDEFLAKVGSPVLNGLTPLLQDATGFLQTMVEETDWDAFNQSVEDTFGKIEEYLSEIDWQAVAQDTGEFLNQIVEKGPAIVDALATVADLILGIAGAFGWVAEKVGAFFDAIWDEPTAEEVIASAEEYGDNFAQIVQNAYDNGAASAEEAAGRQIQAANDVKDQAGASYDEYGNQVTEATEQAASAAEENAKRSKEAQLDADDERASSAEDAKDAIVTSAEDTTEGVSEESEKTTDAMIEEAEEAHEKVVQEFEELGKELQALAEDAFTWGADLGQNYADGIRSKIAEIEAAVKAATKPIYDNMHHSTPEKGPLKDDDTWAPDFVTQFARGLESNAWMLEDAARMDARKIRLGFDRELEQIQAARTMQLPVRTGNVNYYVTIPAKDIREFNDIVRIAENEATTVRQGYVDH